MRKIQEFERNSIILFILLMGANICNYLFQIIIGNLMTVEDYGITNTVLGMIGVLSIPTTIITMVCARYIALYAVEKDKESIISIWGFLIKFVILVSLGLLFAGIFSINSISNVLKLNSNGYMAGVLCVAIVNLFFSVVSGSLQGLKMFLPYGVQNILVAAGKLFLSVLLIIVGWRVYGVIFAIFIGTVAAIFYGIICLKRYAGNGLCHFFEKKIDVRKFFEYAMSAIVAQGCVIAITNGDVLLVKGYFTDAETGIYSSAAVIGKMAMYVSTAVIAALFPLVVEKNQKGEDTFMLFRRALLYGGGTSAVCGLGMSLLGEYVIGILFGDRYSDAIRYLPFVCVFVVPLTFVTILMNYVLAINKVKRFGVSVVLGLAGMVSLSFFMHDKISHLILTCGVILAGIFSINMLWLLRDRRVSVEKARGL